MRDVTWRPPTRRAPPNKKLRNTLLLGGLLAVNAGVIWYHGDPRDDLHQGDAAGSASEPARNGGSATSGVRRSPAAAYSTEGLEAVAAPAPIDDYDPTRGLRHPGPVHRVERIVLESRQTPAGALLAAGVTPLDVTGALASFGDLVDFRRMLPGHELKVRLDAAGNLLSLDILQGHLDQVRTTRAGEGWNAERLEIPIDTVETGISGQVESSLWAALVDDAGESPDLVHAVVDVFAWEIDFYSQVFPGDTFRVLVEKRYAEGKLVGYGDVLAAEFVSAGRAHRGFVHRPDPAAPAAYYDGDGKSMRKQLLKAPLKYGHVTSGFGRRRHPILGYSRAHNGIDYGVPSGTPIWSVGEGRVMRAGWNGGYGRFIEIRHANGWTSQYAHLSKVLVTAGGRVHQKEIIGAVGTSGLSTGPHLHYELKKNGGFVNPLTQKFDPGKSLAGAELEAFQARVDAMSAQLDQIHVAMVATP